MASKLETHVKRTVASADTGAIAAALGKLIAARLAKRLTRPRAKPDPFAAYNAADVVAALASTRATTRRSPRRLSGRAKAYRVLNKWNATRRGTWTHYMIDTICAHSDTASATNANTDPRYSSKRLDFSWAEQQGYITFEI